ncbi:IclR family transcriptional regulator [Sphingomonas sp. 1P08PE]|uniref:IclR family transcriptional regulator n=1 Tax=Sphingomonas sp. 1P08PE TaxID=554122 RepID=UPI0039A2F17A
MLLAHEQRAEIAAGKPVGAVMSAIQILRHLGEQSGPVTNIQIARSLNLNISTSFNILRTLASESLVTFDPAAKAYTLGYALLELANSALDQIGHVRLIHPELERLTQRWEVTTALWLRVSQSQVFLVDRVQPNSMVRVEMQVGQRMSALAGALGRCLAGYGGFGKDEMAELYSSTRSDDPLPFDEFMAEAVEAKRRGYGVDRDRLWRGLTSLSSCIVEPSGRPMFAFSVVTLTARCSEEQEAAIGVDLQETTTRISRLLLRPHIEGEERGREGAP